MAKAYSDDLRRRFLSAYEQGEGTLEELADRFMVSLAWGKKLRGQFERTGRMERVQQRRGTPRKLRDGAREQLRGWVLADHDLTLDQLQARLRGQSGVSVSRAQVARALKGLKLRLKKSRSTPPSETPRRTASDGSSSSNGSARSRRKG